MGKVTQLPDEKAWLATKSAAAENIAAKLGPNDVNQFPDVFLPNDRFINYLYGDGKNGVDFQFRDGRIINFNPADFENLDPKSIQPMI